MKSIQYNNYFALFCLFFGRKVWGHALESLTNQLPWINTIKNFGRHYSDYSFVIYFDNILNEDLDSIIRVIPPNQVIYDGDDNPNLVIPTEKIVSLFVMSNYSKLFLNELEMNIFKHFSCNIFLVHNATGDICLVDRIDLAPGAFVLDMTRNILLSCFDEDEELTLTLIDFDHDDSLLKYHRTYKNLHGKTLKVFHLPYNYTIACRYDEILGHRICEGPDANIIRVLSEKLNFVLDIQEYSSDNGITVWNNMVDAVTRGEADFAAGLVFISAEHVVMANATFTYYTWSTPEYAALFINPTEELGFGVIIRSYDVSVYLIILSVFITIMVIAAVSLFLLYDHFEVTQYTLVLLKLMVEQGATLTREIFFIFSTRYVFSLWLALNIIISTSFKSKLTTAIIKPRVYDYKSMKDLVDNGFEIFVDEWVYEMLRRDLFQTYGYVPKITVADFTHSHHDLQCLGASYLFTNRIALVHSEFSLVHVNKLCEKGFPLDKIMDMGFVMERRVYHGFPLTPRLPYRRVFSRILSHLKASGWMVYWHKGMTFDSLKKHRSNFRYPGHKPLKLKSISTFFVILASGYGVGFLTFLIELIYYHRKKSNILRK